MIHWSHPRAIYLSQKCLFVTKGDFMTQARFDLDKYSARVLDVVKGKYGLKNRNEALRTLIREKGPEYAEPQVDEKMLEELDQIVAEHEAEYGMQAMTDAELKQLLGL